MQPAEQNKLQMSGTHSVGVTGSSALSFQAHPHTEILLSPLGYLEKNHNMLRKVFLRHFYNVQTLEVFISTYASQIVGIHSI